MLPKLARFLIAGLPAFGVAVPLNWALVNVLAWPKPLAYMVVLLVQVTTNFFACKWFVFPSTREDPVLRQYASFLGGIGFFRVLDWFAYTGLVELLHVPFVLAQLINVVVFSLLKFRFSESVFEHRMR